MLENESVLLRRFASTGDAEAFSQIVGLHAGMVYGVCLRVLADGDRAADATQETFFQLLQNASAVTGSVSGWLHRVATHKAVDVIRRDSSRRKREAQYAADRAIDVDKWQDISPYVDEAMDELDDETRWILIEHFFNGRTMTEIAGSGKLSQPTVSRRIENGVERLRGKLKDRGVIGAGAVLVGLLSANAAEAAPVTVLSELGKMAIVGGTSATAAGSVSTVTSAVLAGVKAKIITTAAAVVIVGTGAVMTYNHVTNRGTAAETVNGTQQVNPTGSVGGSVTSSNTNSSNEMSKGEFEELYFGEAVSGGAVDSADTEQAEGGFGGGLAQIENTQPPNGQSQPTGGPAMMGGSGGFGGAFAARFDTPEATVSSFVQLLSMRDMNQISNCFVEGADDLADFRRIMEDPQSEGDLQMKLALESIGPPVEVVDTSEGANGVGVTWLSTVKEEFSIESMTFHPGDKFELDATLVQIGDDWKISNL